MENAVATVKGGLFEQYGSSLSQISGIGWGRRRVAQLLGTKGLRDVRARMSALDGVAPGATAQKFNYQVASDEELGGVRAISQYTQINRATTAADVTMIEHDINTFTSNTTFGSSPPANLDGNPLGTR